MIGRALLAAALAAGCSSPRAPAKPAPPAPEAAAPAPVGPEEVEGARIAAVQIRGLERVGESRARLAVAAKVGEPFDAVAIRDSLRQLVAIEGIADARAVAFRTAGGELGLAFAVTETPEIAAVELAGNRALDDAELGPLVALGPGDLLDPAAAARGAAAITDHYVAAGHFRAEVSWEAEPRADGVALRFAIAEGPRAAITSIEFPGASALEQQRLRALLAKASDKNAVGGVYLPEALDAGTAHILAAYYDLGYIDVRVGPPRTEHPTPEQIEIEIAVVEGERYRAGSLAIEGELAAPERAYRRRLKTRRGQIFNRSRIAADIERLKQFHAEKSGSSEVAVVPLTTVDADERRIDVTFAIEKH